MTTKIKSGVIGDNVVGITQLNVSDGTNGQVLITDGAGTLSFSTISGYTDSDVETYLNTSEIYTDATNNRLGIGTSSPSGELHILSTTQDTDLWVETTNTGGDARLNLYANSTGLSQIRFGDEADANVGTLTYNHSENAMIFRVNDTERTRIDSSGNVGIGTTSPDSKLHIDGNFDGPLVTIHNTGGATSAYAGLEVETSTTGSYVQRWVNAGSELMRVAGTGNVGIGTSSPQQPLVVSNAGGLGFEFVPASGIIQSYNRSGSAYGNFRIDANAFFVHTGSSAAERMRIEETGDMRFGTSGVVIASDECFTFSNAQRGRTMTIYTQGGASWPSIGMWNQVGGSCNHVQFRAGANAAVTGTITATGNNATQYNTSSDYRLKENVDYTWDATTRLKQLKPVRFNWIDDDTNTLEDGFLAHEVSSVVPNAVIGEKDAVYTEAEASEDLHINAGDIKRQQLDHSKLVPLLVKTIQELEARIETLEG
jgi:hypothetical protein